jgi:phosphinothricin acetyltransferase
MAATIRLATKNDTDQMLAIYSPIVTNTSQSFEFEPPTINEMRQRIIKTLDVLPWLSCEDDGVVLGYAYANPHRVRLAYQWSVEVSVYVHPHHRQRGVARALYTSLLALLGLQGFYNAYAGIALPNDSAVRLHEALGFDKVGVYRGVTFKFGAWHDVGWWQIQLRERSDAPVPPVDLGRARSQPGWNDALMSGVGHLKA